MIGAKVNFNKKQFADPATGKLSILEMNHDGSPRSIVPVYFIPSAFPYEKFSLITDREADNIMPIYAISNYGRIWHIYKHIFMSPGCDRGGYVTYSLQRRSCGPINFRAHRLLMLKYRYFDGCEDIDQYEVNHIDGNKQNNIIDVPGVPDNLEWVTRSYNAYHAWENRLQPYERIYYSDDTIRTVCAYLENGNYTYNEISELTGVKYGTVAAIKLRTQWQFISRDYNF